MKRIVCALATSAVAVTLMAGTAAAEGVDETWTPSKCDIVEEEPGYDVAASQVESYTNGTYDDEIIDVKPIMCDDDEGDNYPSEPIQVWLPNPVVDYGQGLMAKGKGLCYGIPAVFAVQSTSDWTQRVFSSDQYVSEDGTAWYKFSASELSGLYGTVTVYVKQAGECEGSATTTATINKKVTPATEPTTPVKDNGTSKPDGSGGLIPAPQTPTAVLSGGTAAAAGVTPAVSPAVVAAAPSAPAAAAPTQSGPSLPVTGASTNLLQLALVAFAAGLGLMALTSNRRRSADAQR